MAVLKRRMGRLSFFFTAGLIYSVVMFVLPLLLLSGLMRAQPAAGVAILAGVSLWWFVAHARRLADSGRGARVALAVAVVLFATLAIAYGTIAGWFGGETRPPDFVTTGRMDDPSIILGSPQWVVHVLASWFEVAGPLASGVLKWTLFGLAKLALVPIGFYSLLVWIRQPVRAPVGPPPLAAPRRPPPLSVGARR